MPVSETDWAKLEERIQHWCEARPEVLCALQVGSRVRLNPPPDVYSDIDVMLFLTDPDALLKQKSWLAEMGEVWLAVESRTAGNDTEILVTYAGGFNVDFVCLHSGSLDWLVSQEVLNEPFNRGYRVLVDKTSKTKQILPPSGKAAPYFPPSTAEFHAAIQTFWYIALYLAKQLRRGELWVVQIRQQNMKEILLKVIETPAHLVNHQPDTYVLGRYLPRWADPRVLQAIPSLSGANDLESQWQVLHESMRLFRWTTQEIAPTLGLEYPHETDLRISGLIEELFTHREH